MPSRRSLFKAIPLALVSGLITSSAAGWITKVQANPSSQANRFSQLKPAPQPKSAAHILVKADTGSGKAEQFANGRELAATHRQRPVDSATLGAVNT